MKKLTIISIIIIILGGVGYYLYLTDLLNLNFLKKGNSVQISEEVKDETIVKESTSQYQGIYHFGESEAESDLVLFYENGKYSARIRSGKFNADATEFNWSYEDLTNVKIEGNKFYSDKANGEFGLFGEKKVQGLKIYDSWSANLENDKSEVGIKTYDNPSMYCNSAIQDLVESSNLRKYSKSYEKRGVIYNEYSDAWESTGFVNYLLNRIENNIIFIDVQFKKRSEYTVYGDFYPNTKEPYPNGEFITSLSLDTSKGMLSMLILNQKPIILSFDKNLINEVNKACKK
jgi:hypothetical protein